MKKRMSIATSAAVSLILLAMSAVPSNAASASPAVIHSASATTYVQECLDQVKALKRADYPEAVSKEVCKVTTGMTIGAERTVSSAEIQADESLSASDKQSLLTASATTAISSKRYSKFATAVLYTVTHGGTFYYNGSRVWVGTTYSGYTGSHNCVINYAAGANITQGSCSESGSTTVRYMYDSWTVYPWGIPFSYGYSMTANLYSNGTAS